MTSAQIYIDNQPVLNGYTASADEVITVALHDRAGVSTWTFTCLYCDETHDPSDLNSTITVDPVTMTGTVHMVGQDGYGGAFILESVVNANDPATVQRYRFKLRLLAPNGSDTYCPNETTEGDPVNGWLPGLNRALRFASPDVSFPEEVAATPNTVVLRDGSADTFAATSHATTVAATTGNITTVNATTGNIATVAATTGNITTVNATTVNAPTVSSSTDLTLNAASGHSVKTALAGQTVLTTAINSSGITTLLDASQSFSIFQGSGSQSWYFISGSTVFESTTATFYDLGINKVFDLNQNGTGASNFTIAAPVTYTFTQATAAGTGANAGKTLTIQSQAGQAQTGGAANNAGGKITLNTGARGTGGSGAAALPGQIEFQCGGTQIMYWQFDPVSTDCRMVLGASPAYMLFAANGTGQEVIFQALAGSALFQTQSVILCDGSTNTAITFALAGTGTTFMTVAPAVTSFTLKQGDTSAASTGASMTIQAQNSTHSASTGGALTLTSGTGLTASGHLNLQIGSGNTALIMTETSLTMSCNGGDTIFSCDSSENITIGGNANSFSASGGGGSGNISISSTGRFTLNSTALALGGGAPLVFGSSTISTATGTVTLNGTQQATPFLVLTASLSGNLIVDFNSVAGQHWIDIRGVTLNGHSLSVKNGSTTVALPAASTTKNMFMVNCDAANGISIS